MEIEPKATFTVKRTGKKFSLIRNNVECAFGEDEAILRQMGRDMQ